MPERQIDPPETGECICGKCEPLHECDNPKHCRVCEDDGYGDHLYEQEKDRRMMEDD